MNHEANPYQSPQSQRFGQDDQATVWSDATWATIRSTVRIMQIIWFALLQGVGIFFFLVVFVLERTEDAAFPLAFTMLVRSAVVFGLAIGLVLDWTSIFLPQIGKQPHLKTETCDPQVEQGLAAIKVRQIISWAFREGPAFLCIIAFMQRRSIEFACYAGILLATMAIGFPTTKRVKSMLERIIR